MTKKQMADKLGYEYIGKGICDGDDGFIVREYGTTNKIIIGYNMEQAQEWLMRRLDDLRERQEQEEQEENFN